MTKAKVVEPENPAALDKEAPLTEAKNAALEAEQTAANAEQPETVHPDPAPEISTDKQAVDSVLAFIDSFGSLNYELTIIRDTLLKGRVEEAPVEETPAE